MKKDKVNNKLIDSVIKAIGKGKDNPALFEDVRALVVNPHMLGSATRESLVSVIYSTVFRLTDNPRLTANQIKNYEMFLRKTGEWMQPESKEFDFDLLTSLPKFNVHDPQSFMKMGRMLAVYVNGYHVDRFVNKNGLNLLHYSCYSQLISEPGAFIQGLVKWCSADINATHAKYGNALHMVRPSENTERAFSKISILVELGLGLNEPARFSPPVDFYEEEICFSYMDYLNKQIKKWSSGHGVSTEMFKRMKDLTARCEALVKAQNALEHVSDHTQSRKRCQSI